jgi:hypothetical protein
MTTVALTASIPWCVPAEPPHSYLFQRGSLLPLPVPSGVPSHLCVRQHDRYGRTRLDGPLVPAGVISRGIPTTTGYLIELAVDTDTSEGADLVDSLTALNGDVCPYIEPVVEGQRLVRLLPTILPTWPSAKLRLSPLPPTPLGSLPPSPIPPPPRVPLLD